MKTQAGYDLPDLTGTVIGSFIDVCATSGFFFWYCTFRKTITHVWEVLECTLCIWWKFYSLKQLQLYDGPCLVSISSLPLWLLVQQHLDAKPHLLLFGWLNGIGCKALTKCKAPTQDAHEFYNTPSMESIDRLVKVQSLTSGAAWYLLLEEWMPMRDHLEEFCPSSTILHWIVTAGQLRL